MGISRRCQRHHEPPAQWGEGRRGTASTSITVDSCAAEALAATGFAQDCPLKPSAGFRSGAKHRSASSNAVAKQGEQNDLMRMEAGEVRMIAFQIADVTKPLAPAGRLPSRGRRIVLGDGDAQM